MTTLILTIIIALLLAAIYAMYRSMRKSENEKQCLLTDNATKKALLDNTSKQLAEAQGTIDKLSPLLLPPVCAERDFARPSRIP